MMKLFILTACILLTTPVFSQDPASSISSLPQAKDYVRETQVRLLVRPLVERLRAELGSDRHVEDQLLALLRHLRTEDGNGQG